jgi:phosphoglucosamine mutase
MALFGTDGVRGVANKSLTVETALKLGRAGAVILSKSSGKNYLVVGMDTRISGRMLEGALVAGICSAGVNVLKVGKMPTPAVAYLTRALDAAGGVVISASHNPVEDNGIKFFGPSGYKLSDQLEAEIEKLVLQDHQLSPAPTGKDVGSVETVHDAADLYVEFLRHAVPTDLTGIKVVLDCANGAAYKVAPRVLRELGAEVVPIFDTPNGININEGCGSTHPEVLQRAVVENEAHLGLAHDGDADRVIAVDEKGQVVDGDRIMVTCARHLQTEGKLKKNTVVVTVMSNMGLHLAMKESGIQIVQTKVGDRYVLEELLRTGACFGGEQSGHIIFLDHSTTGDGILTGLYLLKVIKETGRSLAQLAAQMERLPQLLENVRVDNKETVMQSPKLAEAIKEMEARMQGQGRILVRPSGTESLVRVMAEGRDMDQLHAVVDELVQIVQEIGTE